MKDPTLWYLNRGTGIVLLAAFTATVLLGVLASGRGTRLWPRFVTQGLHRGLSLVTVLVLLAHVTSAVVDEFVDIRWWQAVWPFGATYRPVYLALGTVALDLLVAVGGTSLARSHLRESRWRAVHLTAYVAWAASLVHTWGIGTDLRAGWGRMAVLGCVAVVALAATVRLFQLRRAAAVTA